MDIFSRKTKGFFSVQCYLDDMNLEFGFYGEQYMHKVIKIDLLMIKLFWVISRYLNIVDFT